MRLEVRLGQRGRWVVRCGAALIGAGETQQYAVDLARAIAQSEGGEVIWYDRAGQLQGDVDFGLLSWPSRGRATSSRWDDEALSVGS
jgi:hypothetical protein